MILYDKSLMSDVSVVGGKAIGLSKLTSYGLKVPDFFVVTAGTDLYEKNFAAELDVFAANLHCDLFAVRSSSVNEDGAESSFAGQFQTLLCVPREELFQAVIAVAASNRNKSVESYGGRFDEKCCQVAVIVQRQLLGEYSGVMFTTSPYDEGERIIESVKGQGEALVGGKAVPEERIIKKDGYSGLTGFYKTLFNYGAMLEEKENRALDIEWTFANNKLWFLQMRPLTAVGDALPQIPQREWSMYVYRDFCLFAHGVQCAACNPSRQKKLFGFSVPITEGLMVNGREFYSPENDIQTSEIWKSLDKGNFFESFIARIKKSVRATRRRAENLKRGNFSSLPTDELYKLYEREIEAYTASYVPMMMRPDDYLFEKLILSVGREKAEELASAASAISKKTYYSEERAKFLSAVLSGNVGGYLNEYEWIGGPLGKKCQAITKERFFKRAIGLTHDEAAEKLKEIIGSRKNDLKRKKSAQKKLRGQNLRLFDLISEFIYLRTYTAENSDRYFYYIRQRILKTICNRLLISEEELLLMSPEEVKNAESGFRLSPREIFKRKSGEVILISNGECTVCYTGRSYALLKDLMPAEDAGNSFLLTGKIACMGEVAARVKIVNNLSQADDFEEGCILVTTMTVPEITSALDKAVGIITDEGGITCHAAIIAREYAVPCLVGTGRATAVLKDGMLVKLDCINGRVLAVK